jgi:hypothetical protein
MGNQVIVEDLHGDVECGPGGVARRSKIGAEIIWTFRCVPESDTLDDRLGDRRPIGQIAIDDDT